MGQSKRSEGEVLDGRYRLGKRLGRGGFGDVWRAEELLPDGTTLREVALKLLHASVASSPDWSAEARIIASLRHPGLVTVYAAGLLQADRPIPFVAMELLIGDNLGDMVAGARAKRGVIPWRRVLAWAREAAAALDVIHLAGVVHLDLKPANLFLAEGAIKVLDFGIARQGLTRPPSVRGEHLQRAPAAPEDELATAAFLVQKAKEDSAQHDVTHSATTSHTVVGTPGFMAPEIFEEGEASPATDAYALAACMVQLCTGRLPQAVTGKPPTADPSTTVGAWFAEVQAATVRGQIRDLGDEHPELPRALIELLERWLALDPKTREVERGSLRAALDRVWEVPHGTSGNPYRGLQPYDARGEGQLFGREPDATRIGRELVDHPGVVLYGEGAIGLSSLAIAGIVPELARHFADDKHDWVHCVIPLGDAGDDTSADQVLEASLAAFLDGVSPQKTAQTQDAPQGLLERGADHDTGTVVLLEDLERLATCDPSDSVALEAFLASVAAGAPGVRIVATLDAEQLAALSERKGIGDIIRPWLRFIGPIQPSAVAELVLGPARLAGIEVAGADLVIEDLQEELTDDGTRLSLLSLALRDWWATGTRDAESWRGGGGLLGRLRRHAESVFEDLDGLDRGMADYILLRTISVDGNSRPVAEEALFEASDDAPRLSRVIEVLVRMRLVMRDQGHLRLSHIGLAESWPRLNDLRLHDIDRLTFLEDLRNAAHRWALGGRIRKHLWPSDMLGQLAARQEDVAGELDDTEREFLDASQRQRRVRWMLQGLAALTGLFLVFVGYYINLRVEAREVAQRDRLEEARKVAALGRMVTAARRTQDPYHRIALLAGAIAHGSRDPLLPIELLEAGRDLPTAELMSLTKVDRPDFPWGERWLVGRGGSHLVVYDFAPPAGEEWAPLHYRFRPHESALTDILPFAFDTSVATRDQRGEVKVWRLRENGNVALAATAPEHCVLGPLVVASRAATVACTTGKGVARWNLARPDKMSSSGLDGRVLDVSADGRWVVAARRRELLLWSERGDPRALELEGAPTLAKVSDRDSVVAVVHGRLLDVIRLTDGVRLLRRDIAIREPVTARWAPSGIDLAICDYGGAAEWHYLRSGARAEDDAPLPDDPRPCQQRNAPWPKRLHDISEYGHVAHAEVGPRVFDGGWQLENGTLITNDLVMFDPRHDELRQRLRLVADPTGQRSLSASAAAVFRDDDGVIWQVGDDIRRHDKTGAEVARWRGHLLSRCPTGRLLAWRKRGHARDAKTWEIIGARVDVVLAEVPREPGNVLAADPGCHRVLFQWQDGRLASLKIGSGSAPEPLAAPGGGFVLDGYVYDARPSHPADVAGEQQAAGVWLAMSSGALVRIDGPSGAVRAYGHATPRATAMADGPNVGDLLFADDRGVILRPADGQEDRVLVPPRPDRVWEDIALSPDGRTLWLSWAHGVTVVDLARGDRVGDVEVSSHDRFAPWDDEGSLLLWPFSYKGEPRGQVIPIGLGLAAAAGASASNVRAGLENNTRAIIRLDD